MCASPSWGCSLFRLCLEPDCQATGVSFDRLGAGTQANDQTDRSTDFCTYDDFMEDDYQPEPATETERWLRTAEAWNAVTDVWVARLEQADPG